MSSKIRHKVYAWIAAVAISLGFLIRLIVGPLVSDLPVDFSFQADVNSTDNFYNQELNRYEGEIISKSRYFHELRSRDGDTLFIDHVGSYHFYRM